MNSETIDLIENIIVEIKHTQVYKTLIESHKKIQIDNDVQSLIETFKIKENAYNNARQYGDYHPDLKVLKRAFIEAKTKLFEHPVVQTYKVSERGVQDLLDQCALGIGEAVSKRIFVKTRLPFQSQKGGSSCSADKV